MTHRTHKSSSPKITEKNAAQEMAADDASALPDSVECEMDEPSELDEFASSDEAAAEDDAWWDVFIPDDDEFDPLPDRGDFWDERPPDNC